MAMRPCFSGALFPAFSGCPSARSVLSHTCFPEGLRQHFPTGFQGFCSMCSIASAMLSFAFCCSVPCIPSWNISSNTKKTADNYNSAVSFPLFEKQFLIKNNDWICSHSVALQTGIYKWHHITCKSIKASVISSSFILRTKNLAVKSLISPFKGTLS